MADENQNPEEGKKGGLPIKTIAVVAVVLIVEAVVIVGAFMLSGGPAPVKAEGTGFADLVNDDEKEIEILVAEEKYQNARQGKVFLYDTEVFIKVKKKHEEKLTDKLKSMSGQIRREIKAIIGRADPAHLLAADLATLSRQIRKVLEDALGDDEEGNPYVIDVLIPKCIQYAL